MNNILLGLVATSLMLIAYSSINVIDKKSYKYTLVEYIKKDDNTIVHKLIEVQGNFATMSECIQNEAIALQVYNNNGDYEYAEPSGVTTCKWQ